MARQGSNIISFDDAKRYASYRSSAETYRSSADFRSYRASDSGAFAPVDAFDDITPFESPFASSGGSRGRASVGSSRAARSSYSGRSARSSESSFSTVSRSGRIARSVPSWYDADDAADSRSARSSRASSRDAFANDRDVSPRSAIESYDEFAEENDLPARDSRQGKKKQRLKDKAEKMFARQFGSSDASSESGSRAAVYKGEMGKSHKRAFAEMGGTQRSGRSSARGGDAGKAHKVRSATASRIAVAVGCLVCVAAVLLFLYPTAQQVYLESREEDRLQAEYDALTARNDAMQDRIDYLKTDEGIQDAARQQLGWVKEGEKAVVVEGLADDSANKDSNVNIQIVSGSIPAPQTWYSPVLDVIFGYSDPATAQKATQDASSQEGQAASDAGQAQDASTGEAESGEGGEGDTSEANQQ